ncbi:MAG TPA: 50S ribosomal protein L21 [Nitrospiria bacterium]|nr:50S ribosomal protein L21 [Nitrospiria bacterium]
MYAIIETGGKQYRVAPGETVEVEALEGKVGDTVSISRVFMTQAETGTRIGTPVVPGAVVKAEVVAQGRQAKVVVFKKMRRKNYRRTKGHRQIFTRLKITEIQSA